MSMNVMVLTGRGPSREWLFVCGVVVGGFLGMKRLFAR